MGVVVGNGVGGGKNGDLGVIILTGGAVVIIASPMHNTILFHQTIGGGSGDSLHGLTGILVDLNGLHAQGRRPHICGDRIVDIQFTGCFALI